MRVAQEPVTNSIFPTKKHRHEGQRDVVQRDRDGSRNDVAARQPCKKDRKQSLQADQRGEAKENSDRHAARDGVRGVANRQQSQRMFLKPFAHVHWKRG